MVITEDSFPYYVIKIMVNINMDYETHIHLKGLKIMKFMGNNN